MTVVTSAHLDHGPETALLAKLTAALAALDAGDTAGARESLRAFVNQVSARRGKKIPVAQADQLIAAANAILASL